MIGDEPDFLHAIVRCDSIIAEITGDQPRFFRCSQNENYSPLFLSGSESMLSYPFFDVGAHAVLLAQSIFEETLCIF
jgi:hypothetical protein